MASIFRKVIVTGAKGFIGRHLMESLNRRSDAEVQGFDIDSSPEVLAEALIETDVLFHLAGVNRPERVDEFEEGNHLFTKKLCSILEEAGRTPVVIFSSSMQVELDNPYGKSKLRAEETLRDWSKRTGAGVAIFRLKNVFGKWCRPNYNSVVATFCHNVAVGLPISISDPKKTIELVYIDNVISAFFNCLDRTPHGYEYRDVSPSFVITLGDLARHIEMFRESRHSLLLPDFSDLFIKRLYATYISYLEENDFAYQLTIREDARGELAEFLKQAHFGQIFISRTKPGITRGNHFHHTKVEKFLVVDGDAVVRFRRIDGTDIIEYRVSGKDFKVVDIPPGYTHSIENVGRGELITLFWAGEVFDPKDPDTYPLDVVKGDKKGANS
ncbi:NAD-dependent epimerase/dehydratase family protein [Acidobacteriota bacterium]